MADYLRSGANMGKPRDELLVELSEKYGRSTRQIERYISQRSLSDQEPYQEPYIETLHKRKMRKMRHKYCINSFETRQILYK